MVECMCIVYGRDQRGLDDVTLSKTLCEQTGGKSEIDPDMPVNSGRGSEVVSLLITVLQPIRVY